MRQDLSCKKTQKTPLPTTWGGLKIEGPGFQYTILDTFCCFFFSFTSERCELDRFLLRSPNKQIERQNWWQQLQRYKNVKKKPLLQRNWNKQNENKIEGSRKKVNISANPQIPKAYYLVPPPTLPPTFFNSIIQQKRHSEDRSDRKHSCKESLFHT